MNPIILILSSKVMTQIRVVGLLFAALAVVSAFASRASAESNEQIVYNFQDGTDGATPVGAVVFDKAGNLYGATQNGGASTCLSPDNCGTVYKLTPPAEDGGAWTETVLYVFKGYTEGDGASPEGGLVIDDAGNLYGTTGYGGTGSCLLLGGPVGCGTVYELSPPANPGDPWTETVLYSFQSVNDGYVAAGDLTFDKVGNLYGATLFGGGRGTTCDSLYGGECGTVFELSPPTTRGGRWTETVLHRFAGVTQGVEFGDGASPNGGLVIDTTGKLYGTTFLGGYNCAHNLSQGCGTVFELVPPTTKDGKWMEKLLHVFMNGTDGTQPASGVILGADGSLYGAANGGPKVTGVVFKLDEGTAGKWEETLVFVIGGMTGYYLSPAVAGFDPRGNLYGTTNVGPDFLKGSVARLKPPPEGEEAWDLNVLYAFTGGSDGEYPNPEVVFQAVDHLYGTTQGGGTGPACQFGCGTVFQLGP